LAFKTVDQPVERRQVTCRDPSVMES